MSQQIIPPDHNTLAYRVTLLEQSLKEIQATYVPAREGELRFAEIQTALARIERNFSDMQKQISDLSEKIVTQENESQKRDRKQFENSYKTQNKALIAILSIIGAILTGVLVNYFTHFLP